MIIAAQSGTLLLQRQEIGPQVDPLVFNAEFFADSIAMGLDRFIGKIKVRSNIKGAFTQLDQIGDLQLRGGKDQMDR